MLSPEGCVHPGQLSRCSAAKYYRGSRKAAGHPRSPPGCSPARPGRHHPWEAEKRKRPTINYSSRDRAGQAVASRCPTVLPAPGWHLVGDAEGVAQTGDLPRVPLPAVAA